MPDLNYKPGARLRRYQGYRESAPADSEWTGPIEFLGFEEGWGLTARIALEMFANRCEDAAAAGSRRFLRGNRIETRDGQVIKVIKV